MIYESLFLNSLYSTAHGKAEHTVAEEVAKESNDRESKGSNEHTECRVVSSRLTVVRLGSLSITEINGSKENKGGNHEDHDDKDDKESPTVHHFLISL